MKKSLTILLLLAVHIVQAQVPHAITPAEQSAWPAYYGSLTTRSISQYGSTQSPVSPVRASAEWEEIDYLMVSWTGYPTILKEIVRAAQAETGVIIVCTDSNVVKTALQAAPAVNLSGIHYLLAPFNSIWSRDYGQWNMYTNDVDSLLLFDWIYNRPRPRDDTLPSSIAQFAGVPLYLATSPPNDLVHTGGNFMVDGFGTAFSSNLVLNENPTKTSTQIDSIMQAFFGIQRYIKMPTLPYDNIHHIDMHMKLLDEETILMGQYPAGVSDGPQIEANLLYVLSNFPSVYGTPYKVVRIPMPPDGSGAYPNTGGDYRTYTNSVFINKTVILPTYDPQYDTTALRIYREALPGYTVTGINCNAIIPNLGALHCITKEVATSDPLLISHQSLRDTSNTTTPYIVNARIQHRSGIASAEIYFRTDTTLPYSSVTMTLTVPTGNIWSGSIPPQPAGTQVHYYIHASAVSGRQQVRPLPAPSGYWKFNITGPVAVRTPENKMQPGNPFPNPASSLTCIPLHSDGVCTGRIYMTDVTGRTVHAMFEGTLKAGENLFFLQAGDFPPGIYFIVYEAGTLRMTKKLAIR